MKVIFMGTPEFSVPSLKKLIEFHEVVAVLTQPDRPKGRGKKLTMSPVKEEALKHGIPVYQPIKLKDDTELKEKLKQLNPDFIIVVAFGQILPSDVLNIPKYGCINLHASLLPKYRGAAPINWAVINGDKVSGNTTMLMNEGLDTGDILLKQEIVLHENITAGELHDVLMNTGSQLLLDTIKGLSSGTIVPIVQNHAESSHTTKLSKELAKIDWTLSAVKIKNLIFGLNPWPIAFTIYEDKVMKIYDAEVVEASTVHEPGYIIKACKEGIQVSTGESSLLIKVIQFPGGKALKVEDYIRGNVIETGVILK